MQKFLKQLLLLCGLGLTLWGVQQFCHRQTDGFAILKIRKAFPKAKSTESHEEETRLVHKILSKPLTYLGRGGQCYAFTSQDSQYVVKLLKYNNNYPRIWFRLLPFPFGLEKYRQKNISRKKKRLDGEYQSYFLALQELKEETGIVYFHLEKGSLQDDQLHIQDKLGIFHHLKADDYQFYIQKRGMPFYPKLQKMIENGDIESAKRVIDKFTAYLFKRCEKKITDGDDGIWRNFAFHGEQPFQIDIGQFSYNDSLSDPKNRQEDLLFFTKDFADWLEKRSPELSGYLVNSIQNFPHEI